MKKIAFISLFLFCSFITFADNYKSAVGVKLGWSNVGLSYGASFKQFLSDKATSAIDLSFSLQADDMFFNGFFELHKESRKSSRQVDYLSFYGGPGLQCRIVNDLNRSITASSLLFAPAIVVGFEVMIPKTAFVFGVDAMPMYNIAKGGAYRPEYYNEYFQVNANLRYSF